MDEHHTQHTHHLPSIVIQHLQWVRLGLQQIQSFTEKHPGITLLLGSIILGLAGWKFRGEEAESSQKETNSKGVNAKEEQSTTMKSEESVIVEKVHMPQIIESDKECEDRLFFEVYRNYRDS